MQMLSQNFPSQRVKIFLDDDSEISKVQMSHSETYQKKLMSRQTILSYQISSLYPHHLLQHL